MTLWRPLLRWLRRTPGHPRVPTQLNPAGPFAPGDLLVMPLIPGTTIPPGWTALPQNGVAYRVVEHRREHHTTPRPEWAYRHVRPITDEGTAVPWTQP